MNPIVLQSRVRYWHKILLVSSPLGLVFLIGVSIAPLPLVLYTLNFYTEKLLLCMLITLCQIFMHVVYFESLTDHINIFTTIILPRIVIFHTGPASCVIDRPRSSAKLGEHRHMHGLRTVDFAPLRLKLGVVEKRIIIYSHFRDKNCATSHMKRVTFFAQVQQHGCYYSQQNIFARVVAQCFVAKIRIHLNTLLPFRYCVSD